MAYVVVGLVLEMANDGAARAEAKPVMAECQSSQGEAFLPEYGKLREGYRQLHIEDLRLQRRHLLRQNSSMISADLRPHRYLPLNRLSKPTHERRPSVAGAINPANSGVLQFKITATRVRPA